ncbi:hypothetical protein JB92DRAFT_2936122 [Gautieria morchelliformis]|nr:hypothetical protein JB92DRAFT_2936122 [Gautieria morchelliformis]
MFLGARRWAISYIFLFVSDAIEGLGDTTSISWITGEFIALAFFPADTQLVRAKWTSTVASRHPSRLLPHGSLRVSLIFIAH